MDKHTKKHMAHPPALLAVANACHRDMDPSMRTRILRAAVATLEHPPRSITSIPDGCQAETAMEVLDYLEYSMAPVGRGGVDVGLPWARLPWASLPWANLPWDTDDTWRRLTQAMMVAGICFLFIAIVVEKQK